MIRVTWNLFWLLILWISTHEKVSKLWCLTLGGLKNWMKMTKTNLGSSLKLLKTLFWKRINKGTLNSWTHDLRSTMTCSTVTTRTTYLQRTTMARCRTILMPKPAKLTSRPPYSQCITMSRVYKVNSQSRPASITCAISTSTLSFMRVCRDTRLKLNRNLGSRPPLSNSIYSKISTLRCSSAPHWMTMSL